MWSIQDGEVASPPPTDQPYNATESHRIPPNPTESHRIPPNPTESYNRNNSITHPPPIDSSSSSNNNNNPAARPSQINVNLQKMRKAEMWLSALEGHGELDPMTKQVCTTARAPQFECRRASPPRVTAARHRRVSPGPSPPIFLLITFMAMAEGLWHDELISHTS